MGTTSLPYNLKESITMINLQALYESVVKVAQEAAGPKPDQVEVNGRHFIRQPNGRYDPVDHHRVDEDEYTATTRVVDLSSMLRWANAFEVLNGELHVSRSGSSAALSPRFVDAWHHRNSISKPFFNAYLPPTDPMGYLKFRAWVDLLGDGLQEREGIEAELGSLSAASGRASKIRMTGGVIQVRGEHKEEIIGGLRRRFVATIPFGDPDFTTDVTFLVSCQTDTSARLYFTAQHLELDSALDRYLAWAKERAEAELPDNWLCLLIP